MDLLAIALLVLVILSLSGWGYGYYTGRPARGDLVSAAEPVPVAGPAAWVNPLGILGVLFLLAFIVLLFTSWRPVF